MAFATRRGSAISLGCANRLKRDSPRIVASSCACCSGNLVRKLLRQSLEESCDGYPKGGSEGGTVDLPISGLARFILWDLWALTPTKAPNASKPEPPESVALEGGGRHGCLLDEFLTAWWFCSLADRPSLCFGGSYGPSLARIRCSLLGFGPEYISGCER